MTTVQGKFIVQMTPIEMEGEQPALGRLALEKEFMGELVGTSKGQMLTAQTAVSGSAGYVAIEQVKGRLKGRKGSFILQHHGLMAHGEQSLTISIVPDSGTGELTGIVGSMTIRVDENGDHTYALTYTLQD